MALYGYTTINMREMQTDLRLSAIMAIDAGTPIINHIVSGNRPSLALMEPVHGSFTINMIVTWEDPRVKNLTVKDTGTRTDSNTVMVIYRPSYLPMVIGGGSLTASTIGTRKNTDQHSWRLGAHTPASPPNDPRAHIGQSSLVPMASVYGRRLVASTTDALVSFL
jgi:hypothetical protein